MAFGICVGNVEREHTINRPCYEFKPVQVQFMANVLYGRREASISKFGVELLCATLSL